MSRFHLVFIFSITIPFRPYHRRRRRQHNEIAENLYEWKMSADYEDATNILGLVVFSTVLGITLGRMGPKGKPLLNFFVSLSEAVMMITGWVIWYGHFPFPSSNLVKSIDLKKEIELYHSIVIELQLKIFFSKFKNK